jgi:hypothetical protein
MQNDLENGVLPKRRSRKQGRHIGWDLNREDDGHLSPNEIQPCGPGASSFSVNSH